eukprot:TRINITY_DN7839_c0_g1_i1.p1 TRINITY_DN7839_c0_g1~~TRINITY_DN7839_c0_g1_i1.p1  ORF type:complete len:898 (+),score=178.27 TRINITY_DN7839_c0_g1_i1:624-3317(+)
MSKRSFDELYDSHESQNNVFQIQDIMINIGCHLEITDLASCCCVSKVWDNYFSNKTLWLSVSSYIPEVTLPLNGSSGWYESHDVNEIPDSLVPEGEPLIHGTLALQVDIIEKNPQIFSDFKNYIIYRRGQQSAQQWVKNPHLPDYKEETDLNIYPYVQKAKKGWKKSCLERCNLWKRYNYLMGLVIEVREASEIDDTGYGLCEEISTDLGNDTLADYLVKLLAVEKKFAPIILFGMDCILRSRSLCSGGIAEYGYEINPKKNNFSNLDDEDDEIKYIDDGDLPNFEVQKYVPMLIDTNNPNKKLIENLLNIKKPTANLLDVMRSERLNEEQIFGVFCGYLLKFTLNQIDQAYRACAKKFPLEAKICSAVGVGEMLCDEDTTSYLVDHWINYHCKNIGENNEGEDLINQKFALFRGCQRLASRSGLKKSTPEAIQMSTVLLKEYVTSVINVAKKIQIATRTNDNDDLIETKHIMAAVEIGEIDIDGTYGMCNRIPMNHKYLLFPVFPSNSEIRFSSTDKPTSEGDQDYGIHRTHPLTETRSISIGLPPTYRGGDILRVRKGAFNTFRRMDSTEEAREREEYHKTLEETKKNVLADALSELEEDELKSKLNQLSTRCYSEIYGSISSIDAMQCIPNGKLSDSFTLRDPDEEEDEFYYNDENDDKDVIDAGNASDRLYFGHSFVSDYPENDCSEQELASAEVDIQKISFRYYVRKYSELIINEFYEKRRLRRISDKHFGINVPMTTTTNSTTSTSVQDKVTTIVTTTTTVITQEETKKSDVDLYRILRKEIDIQQLSFKLLSKKEAYIYDKMSKLVIRKSVFDDIINEFLYDEEDSDIEIDDGARLLLQEASEQLMKNMFEQSDQIAYHSKSVSTSGSFSSALYEKFFNNLIEKKKSAFF